MALMLAVGTVGVVLGVRTTVRVAVVIAVVCVVRINGVICCEQQRCAYVLVGVIITVAIPTALIMSVLSGIAAVVRGVSSIIRLAVNFVHMSGEPIDGAAGFPECK